MLTGLKSPAELQAMREGGRLLATIFEGLRKQTVAGISELELNEWVEHEIKACGALPTYKDPSVNFPAVICISTNDKIVHSIPTGNVLQKGDIVGFDLVITYDGMKTDAAFTMMVDDPLASGASGDKKRLIEMTERSLYAGIDAIKGQVRIGDIGAAIEKVLVEAKLGIVRELVGHGIGHEMHQAPDIPNYGRAGTGVMLVPGDTIAIEPMAMLGREEIIQDNDGWTIRTKDGSLAAHFEHTVLILEDGAEILTQL